MSDPCDVEYRRVMTDERRSVCLLLPSLRYILGFLVSHPSHAYSEPSLSDKCDGSLLRHNSYYLHWAQSGEEIAPICCRWTAGLTPVPVAMPPATPPPATRTCPTLPVISVGCDRERRHHSREDMTCVWAKYRSLFRTKLTTISLANSQSLTFEEGIHRLTLEIGLWPNHRTGLGLIGPGVPLWIVSPWTYLW